MSRDDARLPTSIWLLRVLFHACMFVCLVCMWFHLHSFRINYAFADPGAGCVARTHARYSATPPASRRSARTPHTWHASAPASRLTHIR
eukprot:6184704-Pleurochrysis_carterae.AAC.2